MEKLNILLIFMHLIFQCTPISTLNGQLKNFYANSVDSNTTSLLFELPKIIQNTSFYITHISNETDQNNISVTIKEDYKTIPVLINKGNSASRISNNRNNNVDTKNLSQFRKLSSKEIGTEGNRNAVALSETSNSTFILNTAASSRKSKNYLKPVVNYISNSRTPKKIHIEDGNFDNANLTLDEEGLPGEILNKNPTDARDENDDIYAASTETSKIMVTENFTEISNINEDKDNISNKTTKGRPDPPRYNVTQKSKTKIFNITANLEIVLQNNLHKIVGSLETEKGKFLLPHLMDKFESTILRPIKDTLETIQIELSPEYNNNYGSVIQPSTSLFLQKLHEKKQKILNHFGIRCCNHDYPYPY